MSSSSLFLIFKYIHHYGVLHLQPSSSSSSTKSRKNPNRLVIDEEEHTKVKILNLPTFNPSIQHHLHPTLLTSNPLLPPIIHDSVIPTSPATKPPTHQATTNLTVLEPSTTTIASSSQEIGPCHINHKASTKPFTQPQDDE